MFFQNISTAAERNARSKKVKSDDDESLPSPVKVAATNEPVIVESDFDDIMKSLSISSGEILYNSDGGVVPRDVILLFLSDCTSQLMDVSFIKSIVRKHLEVKTPVNAMLVEFQRDMMEHKFHIERNFGCRFLSVIPKHFPGDREIENAIKRFMFVCMKSYLDALKIRREQIQELKSSGNMTKSEILQFFEACNSLMAMPETKKELRQIYQTSLSPPNNRIIQLQRDMLETMGFQSDFGVTELSRIPANFPDDHMVMGQMRQFMMCAQVACKEATMSDQERKEFYAQIPFYMHHSPYMWVIQQQQMQMRQMQMQQGGHSHSGHSHGGHSYMPPQGMPRDPGVQQALSQLVNNPETKSKMESLSSRLAESYSRIAKDVSTWDPARKKEFAEKFADSPLMEQFNSASEAPEVRLQKFLSMSADEIDSMVTMQAVMGADMPGGARAAGLFGAMGFPGTAGGGPSIEHSHEHSHDHAGHCQIHGHGTHSADVATSRSDVMDR